MTIWQPLGICSQMAASWLLTTVYAPETLLGGACWENNAVLTEMRHLLYSSSCTKPSGLVLHSSTVLPLASFLTAHASLVSIRNTEISDYHLSVITISFPGLYPANVQQDIALHKACSTTSIQGHHGCWTKASDCQLFGRGTAFVHTVPCTLQTCLSLWFVVSAWLLLDFLLGEGQSFHPCSATDKLKTSWCMNLSYSVLWCGHLMVLFSASSDNNAENSLVAMVCASPCMYDIVPARQKTEQRQMSASTSKNLMA